MNKFDIILEDWFKYDLLNRTSSTISEVDKLIFLTFDLINDTKYTVKVYYKIGNTILNYMDNGMYIVTIPVIIISLQTIIVLLLYCIFKNKIYKTKTNNVRMVNVK